MEPGPVAAQEQQQGNNNNVVFGMSNANFKSHSKAADVGGKIAVEVGARAVGMVTSRYYDNDDDDNEAVNDDTDDDNDYQDPVGGSGDCRGGFQ